MALSGPLGHLIEKNITVPPYAFDIICSMFQWMPYHELFSPSRGEYIGTMGKHRAKDSSFIVQSWGLCVPPYSLLPTAPPCIRGLKPRTLLQIEWQQRS